ncbi:MAG: ATP-binding cassette domain-containing protein [Butyrivibrio sp.]
MELVAKKLCLNIKEKNILNDINLELKSGKIYGFIGENGSGKTMLFRALSGLIKNTSGEILLDNKKLHKDMAVLPNMGIVIENAGLYPELTGVDNLKLLAKLNKKIGINEVRRAIERVGLQPDDKRKYKKYSLGMKQRIVIAQAIMEQPDILFLDEPTNALDENGIIDIRRIITEEKERGALVCMASHNKEDISELADEVFVIKSGKLYRKEELE